MLSLMMKKHGIGMLKNTLCSLYEEEKQTIGSLLEIFTLLSSPPWSTHEVPTTSSSLESLNI